MRFSSPRTFLVLAALFCAAALPLLTAPTQAQQTQSTQSDESAKRTAWRKTMKETHFPHRGCFNVSYPSTEWQEVGCVTAPDTPLVPAKAALPRKGVRPDTVGDTSGDYTAYVTSGPISSSEGSFPTVTGLGSATNYSLQLNSNLFSTPACSGAANQATCWGWQQFVFQNSGSVYMEYWLINYANPCPGGWNTFTAYGPNYCWKNSAATSTPIQSWVNLPYLTLTGNAVGGSDTAIFTTPGDSLSAVAQDSVLYLEEGWDASEFNVFGNGNGDQVSFNLGSTFVVQTAVTNGTTNAPTCGLASYTAETNNLYLAPQSGPLCCPYGGASPYIQFVESNNSVATATCGATGVNFTASVSFAPTNLNFNVRLDPPGPPSGFAMPFTVTNNYSNVSLDLSTFSSSSYYLSVVSSGSVNLFNGTYATANCPSTLAAGQSCKAVAVFGGATPGTFSGYITVTGTAETSPPAALSGTLPFSASVIE